MSQGAKPRRLTITIAFAARRADALQRCPGLGMQGAGAGVGLAHVEHPHRWHRPAVDAARQLQPRQLQPGLRPRRRRAGDEHGAALGGPAAGDGAGVVTGVALLLVGGVVLLVDDDQAEVVQRREDGRARADADARLAAAQALPFVVALAVGEGRVQDREAVAEPRPEARDRLRRQADLGDQHDRPLAARQRRLDRGEVDLGLARAGDAVQQLLARRPGFAVERGDDALDRGLLLGQQLGPAAAGADLGVAGAAPHQRAAGRDQAALLESAQHAAIGANRRGQLRRRHLPRPQRLQHRALLDPEPLAAAQRLLAGRGDLGPQLRAASAPAARRRRSPAAAPAAARATASSSTPRAIQRPSRTSSGGVPASSASIGSASRSAGSAEASARPTTTPSMRRRPKGTRTTLPTSRSAIASGSR